MGKTSGSDKLDADVVNEFASANDPVLRAKVKGDAFERIRIEADGTIVTGNGTVTPATEVGASAVSDAAYNATSWNGVTDVAPSKNAVRDKIESLSAGASGVTDYTVGTTSADWVHEPDVGSGVPVGTLAYAAGVISQTDATADLDFNAGDGPILQAVTPYPSTSYKLAFDVRFPSGQDAGVVPRLCVIAGNPDAAASNPFLGEGLEVYGSSVGDAASFRCAVVVDSIVNESNQSAVVPGMNVDEWHSFVAHVSPTRCVIYADGSYVASSEAVSGGNAVADVSRLQLGFGGLVDVRNLVITIDTPPA